MPTRTLETRQDCEDFVRGCTILGTGGGGQPESGLEALFRELEAGRKPGWLDPSEVADDAWTACPFLMGSIAPHTPQMEREMASLGLTEVRVRDGMMLALQELEQFHGVKLGAIVAIELGGANTPMPVAAASQLGLRAIDGDYTGRAIPEIVQTTPRLFEKSMAPLAAVDDWGNIVIIKETLNAAMAEMLGKQISVAAFGLTPMAGVLLKGAEAKQIIVKDTLSRAFELGRTIRKAREAGSNPVEAAREFLDGWVIFKGKVVGKDWEDRAGYLWGTHTLEGLDEWAGRTFKVWFKNENHISWLDGKPYVTSPDIISLVDSQTAEPKTNTRLAVGDVMSVLGAKAPQVFREHEKGLDVLGPSHFGFTDIEYKPIEDVVGR
ncbi:MAG: DUF917 domain-containing protein [Chloroflexi bacterium]|nr:DUF917 domain-containing protein [Chloroflexota bacterium]